jgi:hypothetical protein
MRKDEMKKELGSEIQCERREIHALGLLADRIEATLSRTERRVDAAIAGCVEAAPC